MDDDNEAYLNPPPEPHIFIQNAWGVDVTNNREFDLDEFTIPWTRALFEKDFHPFRDSENKNEGAVEVIFYRRNVRSHPCQLSPNIDEV